MDFLTGVHLSVWRDGSKVDVTLLVKIKVSGFFLISLCRFECHQEVMHCSTKQFMRNMDCISLWSENLRGQASDEL